MSLFKQNNNSITDLFTLDAKRRLETFASGSLRHLLKIGRPFKNNFVQVKGRQPFLCCGPASKNKLNTNVNNVLFSVN